MDCSTDSRRETMLRVSPAAEGSRRVLSTARSSDPGAAGDAGSGLRCAEGMDDSSLEEEEENPIPPQHRPKWCRAPPYRRTGGPEEAEDTVQNSPGIWASKDRTRLYMYQRNAIDEEQASLRSLAMRPLYARDLTRIRIDPEALDGLPTISRYSFEDDSRTKLGRLQRQPVAPASLYNSTNGFEGNSGSHLSGSSSVVLQGSPLQDIGLSRDIDSVPNMNCIFSNSDVMCRPMTTPPLDTLAFTDANSMYKTTRSSFERLSLNGQQKCRTEDTKQEIPYAVNSPTDLLSRQLDAFSDGGTNVTLLNLFSLDSVKGCEDRTLFNFRPELLFPAETSFNEIHICQDSTLTPEVPSLQHSRLTTAYGIPVQDARPFTGQPDLNANGFQMQPIPSSFEGYPAVEWTTVPGETGKKTKADKTEVPLPDLLVATPTSASVTKTRVEMPAASQENEFLFTPNDFPELPAPSLQSSLWQADRTSSPISGVSPSHVAPLGTYTLEMPSTPVESIARLNQLRQSQSRRMMETQESDPAQQHRVKSPLRWYNPSYHRYKFIPAVKDRIHNNILPTLQDDAYLSIFYIHIGLHTQLEAADRLYLSGWRYHKVLKIWMKRITPSGHGGCLSLQNGTCVSRNLDIPYYVAFDPFKWEQVAPVYNVDERYFEERPILPDDLL